jgi:hypothetical protein
MPASVIGADVVNCVAAFAPVRHTLSYGTTSPSSAGEGKRSTCEGWSVVDMEVANKHTHPAPA